MQQIWLLPAVPVMLFAIEAPTTEPSVVEREAIAEVLSAYRTALQAGEPEKVARLLGPSYFMADESSSDGPERLKAHLFLTGPRLEAWPSAFLKEASPYSNEFRLVSVSVRGDAAVALTRDTGSNRFGRWRDEEAAWFLGRISGQWRIVGFLVRDIQLPENR